MNMHHKTIRTLTFILLTFIGFNVNAVPMNFSYTFTDGTILTGVLDGTTQGDSDTVFINSFGPVSYDGTNFPSIGLTDFSSVSDFPIGLLQPLVSFSGNAMDIFACPNGFDGIDGTGDCLFADDTGFFLDGFFPEVGAGNGLGTDIFETFDSANWSLVVASNPVPTLSTWTLLLLILAMGIVGFRFAQKT